jgi:GrpB-like predicted nucleotidyltransferase (UPF0157 family)
MGCCAYVPPSIVRVVVVPHDAGWVSRFDAIAAPVQAALDTHALSSSARIEHVGSTSVPGLAAKPVIDIDVVLAAADDLPQAVAALRSAGYTHRGELGVEGRHAFKFSETLQKSSSGAADGGGARNLYVCFAGCDALLNHLNLRDHLIGHTDAVTAYSDLKLRLAQEFPYDMDAYCEGKTQFILNILAAEGMSSEACRAIEHANKKPAAAHLPYSI